MPKTRRQPNQSAGLYHDFLKLRHAQKGEKRITEGLKSQEQDALNYLKPWYQLSQEDDQAYPSQGLLNTPFDNLPTNSIQMLPQSKIIQTLRLRWYFLQLFNHPYRMLHLNAVNQKPFIPPPKIQSDALQNAFKTGLSLSIGDIGAGITGTQNERISRKERYGQGPFVKLGKYARTIFNGSESPDVWNSVAAVSTMAASHCLTAIPRNGLLHDIKRQADFARQVFDWLKGLEENLLQNRKDRKQIAQCWRQNVMGTLEASPEKALKRAEMLYNAGVKAFRVYSPEPGTGPVKTVSALRKHFGQSIEIFTGNLVEVSQAIYAQEAGADGIIIGVGGGGRCITGVRSGSLVDWPELLWKLRGEVSIPIIVHGGASDHVAVTLLLGASGIGVSRIVAGGTIESPGGALFYADQKGKLFKPYGGEASIRTKYLEGKMQPFNIPSFVEGEVTMAQMSYVKYALPTLTYNLHLLTEDAILALVFRGVKDLTQLHALNPSPLKRSTNFGDIQRRSH